MRFAAAERRCRQVERVTNQLITGYLPFIMFYREKKKGGDSEVRRGMEDRGVDKLAKGDGQMRTKVSFINIGITASEV